MAPGRIGAGGARHGLRVGVTLVWLSCWPAAFAAGSALPANAACSAAGEAAQPASFDGCLALQRRIEAPGAFMGPGGFRLAEYEALLDDFLGKSCHRNTAAGWVRDKRLRDTGPYVAFLDNGQWKQPSSLGTHLPVVVWYNAPMLSWLRSERPAGSPARADPAPVADGAMMVKEMYPPPAARCADVPPERLRPPPSTGVALMVRASQASHDGWFWGAWWDGFKPDWPAQPGNGLANMGFAPYCLNCHASAASHSTFADLANIRGEPGEPRVYLSQNFLFDADLGRPFGGRHGPALASSAAPPRHKEPLAHYNPAFAAAYPRARPPTAASVAALPSQTYDHSWVGAGGPGPASQFLTSDQCLGCHAAGSTGLQFDMTRPAPGLGVLINDSPYAGWRSSPMGLGGRDPFFFAQLASETQTFHPKRAPLIQNVCLGCHAVQGQRQFQIDHAAAHAGDCGDFKREQLDALPYPSDPTLNPALASARYAALGRDGIACTVCHRIALTDEQVARAERRPENDCARQRQQLLNPHAKGLARSFTGSFLAGPADTLGGPFAEPKTRPMSHALGIKPVHDPALRSSDLCGSCHTVHLPIFASDGRALGFTYEQTTFPEWAFSAYRSGVDASGRALPQGRGERARSCQDCHMKSFDRRDGPLRSKIASIQESSNFPAASYTLPAADIDLQPRAGFARHTLVGLNLFLVQIAQQFPSVLGIPSQDPMLGTKGLDPLLLTERAIVDQAEHETATIAVGPVQRDARTLQATVTVNNLTGHKLPTGVGFRRLFVAFEVLDAAGQVLWASGRTDANGAIVDAQGKPIAGEYWWARDCSARLPGVQLQPHRQTVVAQDQAQIYQELVTSPAPVAEPRCGAAPVPGGQLTTSFLSICGRVKDNRLLPHGFLGQDARTQIALAIGADAELAREAGPDGVDGDPDYAGGGGGDTLLYRVELSALTGTPAYLRATLYSQSTPPSYLQDRFCTSAGADTDRLYYLAGHLDLGGTRAEGWKLRVVGSGLVRVP